MSQPVRKRIGIKLVPGGWTTSVEGRQPVTSSWRNFTPYPDDEKCRGCGSCEMYCPDKAIKVIDGKAVVDYDHCKGCGVCSEECPFDAIDFEMERAAETAPAIVK